MLWSVAEEQPLRGAAIRSFKTPTNCSELPTSLWKGIFPFLCRFSLFLTFSHSLFSSPSSLHQPPFLPYNPHKFEFFPADPGHPAFWGRLLLRTGDVESNPGPACPYPCGICQANVTWRTWSIKCPKCSLWFHKDCLGLTTNQIKNLSKSKDFNCPQCSNPTYKLPVFKYFTQPSVFKSTTKPNYVFKQPNKQSKYSNKPKAKNLTTIHPSLSTH